MGSSDGGDASSRKVNRNVSGRWGPCVISQIDCQTWAACNGRIQCHYSSSRFPWFGWSPSKRRGFASSSRNGSASASSGIGPPAATASGAEGSACGEPSGAIVKISEYARKAVDSCDEMYTGAWEASRQAAT